jgi:predicted Zn-dependent protease
LAALSGCATVPETNRPQLLIIGKAEETKLGLSEFTRLKQDVPISKDAQAAEMLNQVGKRISAVAPLPDAQWEFVLFDQPDTPNAFCLPGGKIGVYSGILPITANPAGLAAVIGHEVAHAVARHGAERMSEGLLLQVGGQALGAALQTQPEAVRQLAAKAYGIGGTVGIALPHSRNQELDADHLGLLYMARAGYDPLQAVEFWKRFGEFKKGQPEPPRFLSTHPLDQARIQQLEALMPGAIAEYDKAGTQ